MTKSAQRMPRRRGLTLLALATLMGGFVLGPAAASAVTTPPDDDGLGQTINPDQAQGTGQVVIDAGHIDFGPTLNTGEFLLQVHDDTVTPSVWRDLDDVVIHLGDSAVLEVPDDPTYDFLQLAPGTPVHVVPQTQNIDVTWLGWNTQEPQFMSAVTGGVTLSITEIQGPGDVTVYLQSGNFSAPEVLWSTLGELPASSWVEINTHTHANWVFTETGEYLVNLSVSAEGIDGSVLETDGILRLAVGADTPLEPVFDAVWEGGSNDTGSPDAQATAPSDDASLGPIIATVAAVVVLALVIAIVVILITGRSAKRKALAARVQSSTEVSK
jgi:surface-anchored protein